MWPPLSIYIKRQYRGIARIAIVVRYKFVFHYKKNIYFEILLAPYLRWHCFDARASIFCAFIYFHCLNNLKVFKYTYVSNATFISIWIIRPVLTWNTWIILTATMGGDGQQIWKNALLFWGRRRQRRRRRQAPASLHTKNWPLSHTFWCCLRGIFFGRTFLSMSLFLSISLSLFRKTSAQLLQKLYSLFLYGCQLRSWCWSRILFIFYTFITSFRCTFTFFFFANT